MAQAGRQQNDTENAADMLIGSKSTNLKVCTSCVSLLEATMLIKSLVGTLL